MKNTFLTFTIFLIASFSFAQNNHLEQFRVCLEQNDTLQQFYILRDWEKFNNNDPELYTAYINHYYTKAKTIYLSLESTPTTEESLAVTDSLGNTKHLNERIAFNHKLVDQGLAYIDEGIRRFPNRLDMRFGKIYVLKKVGRYNEFTQEIIKVINHSDVIKNQWTWAENKTVPDAKKFLLSSVQNYVLDLYDTENDDLLDNMKLISESVLRYYPAHVESYSNIAVVFLNKKDPEKALKYLLIAEQMNSKDTIILSNIAKAYVMKGDKTNAIKYYELVKKYGDSETQEFANKQMNELNQK